MSAEYPIIAVTGSSGSGSSTVTQAFDYIFRREYVKGVYIQGSAFHRYDRKEMLEQRALARKEGRILSHFGPEGNHLEKLESLFIQYASTGTGMSRYYLHTQKHADFMGQQPGTFTPWTKLKKNSDLLLYRGLHGAAQEGDIDLSEYPDLLIGIVPNVNLEWMRKINRDTQTRGYSAEQVKETILERLSDYIQHITPQFQRTHINFQLIPVVDTSDPFTETRMPSEDECYLVVHFQRGQKPDFQSLLKVIPKSFMSNTHTLVVPGGYMFEAMEVILMPVIHDLVVKSRELRNITKPPKKTKCGLIGRMGQSLD